MQERRGTTRRTFLEGAATAAFALPALRHVRQEPRLKVAAICTEFTYRSHVHVILENFLEPYYFNGKAIDPRRDFEVVSIYLDQFPEGEMGRAVAKERGIPILSTISEALTLGGKDLAVDAVLSIGEHGKYPTNEKGQVEYPRKRFFDEITAVFEKAGRGAPVFNDKHLSYRWDWARAMYDTAKRLRFPLMAGSSVPLAERRPPLEQPNGVPIEEALSIHGGNFEGYDFHGLEILQSIIESRKGGESGVARLQFLEGDALWNAAQEGRWSTALADAAMAAELGAGAKPIRELVKQEPFNAQPIHGILIEHVDGLRSTMLRVGSSGIRWNLAFRAKGDSTPRATRFYVGPWQNRCLFKALAHAIQVFFREQKAPYPVERTLLTTGVLAAAVDSRFEGSREEDTPELAKLAYQPVDFTRVREMGATWKLLTEDTPEPKGMHSVPAKVPK